MWLLDQVAKATLIGDTTGLIKYVVGCKTRQVLGCHVIGPEGTDLIHTAVLTMQHGGTIDEIAQADGILPTLQEGMESAAYNVVLNLERKH